MIKYKKSEFDILASQSTSEKKKKMIVGAGFMERASQKADNKGGAPSIAQDIYRLAPKGIRSDATTPTCPVKKGTTKSRLRNCIGPTNPSNELLLF